MRLPSQEIQSQASSGEETRVRPSHSVLASPQLPSTDVREAALCVHFRPSAEPRAAENAGLGDHAEPDPIQHAHYTAGWVSELLGASAWPWALPPFRGVSAVLSRPSHYRALGVMSGNFCFSLCVPGPRAALSVCTLDTNPEIPD